MSFKNTDVGHKIILAGVDGCGKSTLAKKIQQEIYPDMNYKIVHSTRTTKNDLLYFEDLLDSPDNIIFDRFYIDQFVYQTAKERIENHWLTLSDLDIIENKVSADEHEIIFVDTDLNTCLLNCLKDSEDYNYNIEYITDLYKRYQYFFSYISQIPYSIYKNDFKREI